MAEVIARMAEIVASRKEWDVLAAEAGNTDESIAYRYGTTLQLASCG